MLQPETVAVTVHNPTTKAQETQTLKRIWPTPGFNSLGHTAPPSINACCLSANPFLLWLLSFLSWRWREPARTSDHEFTWYGGMKDVSTIWYQICLDLLRRKWHVLEGKIMNLISRASNWHLYGEERFLEQGRLRDLQDAVEPYEIKKILCIA